MDESEERGIGERGPDKQPRDFNPKSLFNLKQFQKPVPTVNSSASSSVNWKVGIIAIGVIIISAIFWKLYQRKKHSEETKQN